MGLFLTPAALSQNNTILTAVSVCDIRCCCILSHILVDVQTCSLSTHSSSLLLLHSFPGRRKEERSDSLPGGNLSMDANLDSCRRPSLFKMVSLGKLKRESMSDKTSQEAEEEPEEEEPVVKTKDPLSGNSGPVTPPPCAHV